MIDVGADIYMYEYEHIILQFVKKQTLHDRFSKFCTNGK